MFYLRKRARVLVGRWREGARISRRLFWKRRDGGHASSLRKWANLKSRRRFAMLLPIHPLGAGPNNVRISTSNCSCDWILLEIADQNQRFPTIALKPNSSKNIPLPGGRFMFFFSFQRLAGAASISLQVATPHANSPFPAAPKVGTAQQGDIGLVALKVEV